MLIELIDLQMEYYEQSEYIRPHRIRLYDATTSEEYVITLTTSNMEELKQLLDKWSAIEYLKDTKLQAELRESRVRESKHQKEDMSDV